MNIWLFENGCLIAKNTAGVEIYKLSYEHESGAVWASVSAVFRLVVAFVLDCQAIFRKLFCSIGLGVLGLRWTSVTGHQLRALPDHRFGFAWRAAA